MKELVLQYKFHIFAVIEKRNQDKEEIEKLIEKSEKKITSLFEFNVSSRRFF